MKCAAMSEWRRAKSEERFHHALFKTMVSSTLATSSALSQASSQEFQKLFQLDERDGIASAIEELANCLTANLVSLALQPADFDAVLEQVRFFAQHGDCLLQFLGLLEDDFGQ